MASPVSAQDMPGLRYGVEGGLLVMPEADFDSGGSVSLVRWSAGTRVARQVPGVAIFGLGLTLGGSHYEFNGRNGLTGPIDTHEVSLSAPIRLPLGPGMLGYLIPKLDFSGEAGADIDEATTSSVLAGISWRLSPALTLGPGVGVFGGLDDETDIVPILIVDWKLSERLTLSNGPGIGATRGPGIGLSYAASPVWKLGVVARYEKVQFRLDEDADIPGGIGTHTSTPVIATASWQPKPGTRISGFAGAAFDGSMKFKDDRDRTVGESGYDTAPIFGVTASFDF